LSFSSLYNDILNKKEKISLIGLGYVGMPIAVSFSRKVDVIGFDVNQAKINLYKNGIDPTKEVGDEAIAASTVDFTADETRLKEARFHIVAVPTPVNMDHTPDLSPVIGASTALVSIPILLKMMDSSFIKAILMSRCEFSITLAASATLIDSALCTPASTTNSYTLAIISRDSSSIPDTTLTIVSSLCTLSPGLILSGE
jgi:hypothetical protein